MSVLPWYEHPFRLINWLDMEKFSAERFPFRVLQLRANSQDPAHDASDGRRRYRPHLERGRPYWPMSDLLDTIQRTVEATVEGAVKHRDSVPVVETFRGQTVWEGVVEVFDVAAPPPAVDYGWAVDSDQGPQYVTVKGIPPADSPLGAVRVWLVRQSKKENS